MKYKTEKDILEVVRGFETGTISREKWKHAEHLTVALYYILHSPTLSDACDKMRGGIFNLLKSFGVDLNMEMPYHETLTVFWMRAVVDFKNSKNGASFVETCNELIERFDKDYPLRFYSNERLFSDEARKEFIEADL
ncbi:MAG: hypothetical protein M3033_02605 [Acidobacteriota bacterium]|nr:hypothetical protein [Acidobacteriota bacterium]